MDLRGQRHMCVLSITAENLTRERAKNARLRKAMRKALEHLDNERWNHIGAVLLRALGDLPPVQPPTNQKE